MNPGIFYLYEYKNNQKYRNVGFLKLMRHYRSCTLQLHVRGIPVTRQDTLKLSAFYMENETAYTGNITEIACDNHAVSARFTIAESDFPDQHTLNTIHGFILQLPDNGLLAAAIPGITLDPRKIIYDGPAKDIDDSINGTVSPETDPESSINDPDNPAKDTDDSAGEPADAPSDKILEAESVNLCKVPDTCTPADYSAKDNCAPESSCTPADQATPDTPAGETDFRNKGIRKIQRSEMSVLPRRYWNLANNSFLLHGYNNYNHLLLVEKDGHYWLGIPGIYDTREARAAELFGFPQFTTSYNDKLSLSDEERNDHGNFGYWCRFLK